MPEQLSLEISSRAFTSSSPSVDLTALQRALVFTKQVYRNPILGGGRKRSRRPIEDLERLVVTPIAPAPRQYEIIDGVDERLLPWSCD